MSKQKSKVYPATRTIIIGKANAYLGLWIQESEDSPAYRLSKVLEATEYDEEGYPTVYLCELTLNKNWTDPRPTPQGDKA